jgi:hypothetical protein
MRNYPLQLISKAHILYYGRGKLSPSGPTNEVYLSQAVCINNFLSIFSVILKKKIV